MTEFAVEYVNLDSNNKDSILPGKAKFLLPCWEAALLLTSLLLIKVFIMCCRLDIFLV